jgi:hypothetical protein
MSRLAPAIRLRRRQLDALATKLAGQQAAAHALAAEADELERRRSAERHLTAAAPIACDAWFAHGARRLVALGKVRSTAEQKLADLRRATVEARARLQLLEDAAAEARRAEERRRHAKADAALDDRIASTWGQR